MKKVIVFATAALLVSGAAFATKGKKSCGSHECCKDKKETTTVKKDKEVKKTKV